MNNFMKDELEEIANCVIDNYCDHRMTSRTNLFVEVCHYCNKEA